MTRQLFVLAHDVARRNALEAVRAAPDGMVVEVREKTRSLEANARLWACLTAIAEQVEWHGQKLSQDDWKHIFSAALKQQRVVPGLDGGFVVLGQHTSRMTKREFSDLLEIINAFAAERGVTFPWESPPPDMAGGNYYEVPF